MLSGTDAVQTVALASTNTFGVQQTIVILINFTDNTSQPYQTGTARSVTFAQTNNFYQENSYG